jgi:tetratricopeptide (TPR) repeat protein
MSGRVNTKFVVGLSVTLIAIIVGLMGVWYAFVRTDPAEYIARADAMLAQGQYAQAVDFYRKARSGRPHSVELMLKQAQAMEQITVTDSRQARGAIGQLLELYKGVLDVDSRNVTAMRNLADIYMKIGRELGDLDAWDQLFKITNTAVLSDPSNMVARQYRGIAQVNRMLAINVSDRDVKTAWEDLEAAHKADTDDPDITHHMALWHVIQFKEMSSLAGNPAKAAEHQKQAIALSDALMAKFPDEPRIKVYKLRVLSEMRMYDQAQTLAMQLEKLLSNDATSADLVLEVARQLAARASSNSRQMKLDETSLRHAEKLVDASATANPADLRLALLQGQILTVMGEYDQAIKVFGDAAHKTYKALPLVAYQSAQLRRAAAVQYADLKLRQADGMQGAGRDAALAEVEKLIVDMRAETGESAYVSMLTGKLHLTRGEWGKALKELDSASAQFNDRKPDILLLSASACAQLGELGAAVERLETLLKVRGDYLPARIELAKLQLRLSQPQQAKQQIDVILREEGAAPSEQTQKLLAIYYAQTDQTDQAIATYKQLDPANDLQVALSLARLQAGHGQRQQAVNLLTQHFNKDPRNLAVLRELVAIVDNAQTLEPYFTNAQAAGADPNALVLLKSKLTDKTGMSAINAVNRIVNDIDDPFARAMSQYTLNMRLGKEDVAKVALREAAGLQPDHPRVMEALFVEAISEKDWDKAQELATKAKSNNADLADGTLFAGRLELARGQTANAVVLLTRGMKQRPVYSEGWRWLAQAQRASGDLDAAIDSYQESIRQRPDNLPSHEGLADAYDATSRRDQALIIWRQVYQISPGNRAYREKYLAYEQRNGDPGKALEVRMNIAHAEPDDLGNLRGVAVLLAHLKQMDKARQVCQQLFTKDPSDRANYGAYAAVLAIDNQLDQARGVLENYIKQKADQADAQDYMLYARFLISVGQRKQAYEQYRQAIKLDQTRDMQASRELADALFGDSRFDKAAEIYQTVWDHDRQDGRVGYRLVETLQRNSQFDQAKRVLERLEDAIGKSATSLLLKAQIARNQNELSQAREYLNQAVDMTPDDAMVYFQRASMLLPDVKMENQVISDLRKVLELDPNFTAAHRVLAQIHLRHDSFDQAVKEYESVLAQNPNDVNTRIELLQMYINGNDLLAAKTLLSEATRRHPDQARWPRLQADIAIRERNHRQAAKYLLQAFELEPRENVLAAMGLEMIQAGAAGMAITKIEENPQLLSNNAQLRAILGRAHYKLGRKAQGKAEFETALRQANSLSDVIDVSDQIVSVEGVEPTQQMLEGFKGAKSDIWLQVAIARTLVGASKYQEAVNRLNRIKPQITDQEKSEFSGLLSLALHNSGKFEEAAGVYKQVLDENPNSFAALNNLAYLLATNLNRPAEALPYAARAAESAPNDPQVLDTLGWVQFLAGHHDEAEATLRRSVRIRPFTANTYHLAEVMIKDGQTRYATELLDMARQFAQQSADKQMLDKVNVRLKEVTQ